ncbi:phage tail tip lysozyme [Aureimonas ureilytica]|uniref:phage tail tip lysozyme n=1 Tax=Aureimonas ureilytica TaxID=401562 RepID=UPI003CEAF57A
MAAREFVRTLTVRSREEGAAEVARSLHSVADAQQRVTRVTEEGARVVDMTASKLASVERAWNGLNGRLEGNTSAYRNFIRESNAAKQALDAGLTSVDRYKEVIRQLRDELQAAGTTRLGFNVDQSGINALLGVRAKLASSARDSASVFENEIRLMDGLQVKASRLRAELDPLGAAYERMNAQIADYRQMADRQVITQGELAQATARSRQAFDEAASSLKPVNDNVKLTAGQVQNLGYQLNDTVTMLAMGASPFSIIASQGGQVVQALGDGPQGVRGSLAAIGTSILGLLTPTNLLIAGFAAVAAGAVYFAMRGREKVVPLTDAMTTHRDAVSAVSDAYGAAASKAAEFQKASSGVAAFNVRQSRAQLELSARASLNDNFKPDLLTDLFGSPAYQQGLGDSGKVITEVAKEFAAFEKPVLALVEGLEKGTARADLFVDAVAEIANLQPANKELQEAAKKLIDLAGAAAEAQRQMAGLGPAFAKAARDAKQFNDLAGDLGQFIPDRQTDVQRIEQTYQQMMRLAKTEADITRAQDLRRLSLEGLAEVETRRRDGYALDVRAVTEKSAVERAQIEYERTYADVLASTNDAAQAARQGQEARDLSLKQSQHDLTEAMNERIRAGQQQVDQLQQEIDTFGKSAGEVARLRTETELLTAARNAARQAGEIVDPAEEAKIQEQAAAIGELTDRLTRLNLGRDQEERMRQLQAEAGLIGMNDDVRRIALAGLEAEAELRRQGIPLNDTWGQSYVANARQIATMEGALDKQQSAFEDLRDAAKDFFETLSSGGGIMDALASTFGKFAQQLASKGFDQLYGGLFGKGQSNAPTIVGAITQAAAQIPAYGSGMGVDQTYAAPLGAVTRAPLPPVVTGEGFSSSKASTVARQSVPAQMWNFFASKGLASHQIAGILGNARAESAFNPNARGDGGAALGLFQWNDRANAMKAFVGPNWQSNVQGQLDFAWKELQTSESKAYRALLQATTVTQATEAFLGFERPHGYNTGVRNSHNYSGRVGYAQEAFSQFEGRSPSPVVEARTLRKGVAEGVVDANQKLGGDNWGGLRTVSPGVPPTADQSGGLFGARGQAGFSVLGAGLGAFSNGYQSGSPLSGGLGGAFSGYGAGGAISSFLGIGAGAGAALGVVGGAALGIIGGILGAREKRKQAHQQAAEQWAQVRPQYEAFDASLSGDRGDFRTYITDAWNQLSGFMDVGGKAWKMGKGNSTAQFDSTGRKLFEGFLKMLSEFQEGFDSMVSDMASGQGLQGAFAKGRAATKDLASQLKKTRDDIDIAFGNIASIDFLNTPAAQQQAQETERQRADAIARYNDAAGKYALSLLYTAEKVSDVQQTIDGLRGTAAGLVPIFKDLGWNADEAARVIDERLNQAIANIARGLEQNLADRIDELNGKGYFTSVRSFLEEYEGLQRDFSAAGADASRLPEFFKLQAQSIVDGAELTGEAFNELVRLFPSLNGVVTQFVAETVEAAKVAESEIADAIRGYEDRLADVRSAGNELAAFERRAARERVEAAKFGADALASLEKTLAAERAAIVLSQAKVALEQSYQAETDRINDLLNARRDEANELESTISKLESFRDQVRELRDSLKLDDNLSTLNAQDRVTEAGRQFRELLAKARGGDEDARGRLTGAAQEYLNEAKGYYQTSPDYGDIFEEVNRALADTQATTESALSVSQSQLDALKRQITLDEQQLEANRKQYEAILGLKDGIKSLEVAFREYAAAAAAARAAGITVPGAGGGGSSSGGANYDAPRVPGINVSTESAKYLANNADVAAAIAAGQTFGLPAGMAPEVYASAHFGLHGQTEGRKWATGGLITGPGTGTSDSIPMWASNGEFMMREAAVSSVGAGTMDYINRTGRLPTIAMPASPRMVGSGNDNRGIEQRLDAMQRTLIALTTTTGGGLQRVAEAGEAGARATEQRALAERRSANNKQAA